MKSMNNLMTLQKEKQNSDIYDCSMLHFYEKMSHLLQGRCYTEYVTSDTVSMLLVTFCVLKREYISFFGWSLNNIQKKVSMNCYLKLIVYILIGENMKKKRRVHPTVNSIDLELLEKYGLSPATALKQRACQLASGNDTLAIREELLEQKKEEYLEDIQRLNKRVQNVENELEKIYSLKANYNPVNSENYDKALGEVTRRLSSVLKADENGEWDLNKISLQEVAVICNTHQVSVESVLCNVHENLLRYLEGYTRR